MFQGSNPDMDKKLPWGSFLGLKQPWCDVEHLYLSSSKVKNEWSYVYTTPIRFHVEVRDKFTCLLLYNSEISIH
jgi:hypothetical protein